MIILTKRTLNDKKKHPLFEDVLKTFNKKQWPSLETVFDNIK